jgi:hypothetical protein
VCVCVCVCVFGGGEVSILVLLLIDDGDLVGVNRWRRRWLCVADDGRRPKAKV